MSTADSIPLVDVVTITRQDLLSFRSDDYNHTPVAENSPSRREFFKDDELVNKIGEAFGAQGLGLIAIADMPEEWSQQCQELLSLAAQWAALPYEQQQECIDPASLYSTGWSHGKEQFAGKPDLSKGSFYANPLTDHLIQGLMLKSGERPVDTAEKTSSWVARPTNDEDLRCVANALTGDSSCNPHQRKVSVEAKTTITEEQWAQRAARYPEFYADNLWPHQSLPELKPAFVRVGQTLTHLGRRLAAVCDAYVYRQQQQQKQHNNDPDVLTAFLNTPSLEESLTQSLNAKGRLLHYFACPSNSNQPAHHPDNPKNGTEETLWCGWHNDHGSLTGLVPAIYLGPDGAPVTLDRAEDDDGGLLIMTRQGQVVRVVLPPNSCAFQVGETAQIQSGGWLQATPHAVKMSSRVPAGTTRESFALFLEPEFDTVLTMPIGSRLEDDPGYRKHWPRHLSPLSERWRPGMTFGEFHRSTVSSFLVPTDSTRK